MNVDMVSVVYVNLFPPEDNKKKNSKENQIIVHETQGSSM